MAPLLGGFIVLVPLIATPALSAAQPAKPGRTKTGIAYDVQGKGPVVVLITGSNLDRRMWAREATQAREVTASPGPRECRPG